MSATDQTGATPESPEPNPEQVPNLRPHFRQLAIQFAAAILVLSLAWPYYGMRNEAMPWPESAFAVGLAAALIAVLTRQPWWWCAIHAVFAPLAWAVAGLAIDPGWFLLAFGLLLLVYRGALDGQVPLYLSNTQTAAALAELTADRTSFRFLDLGAGIGSVVCPLAGARPECRFTGVENAPVTWAVGRLRSAGLSNCDWRWGDIWQTDLSGFDVVYAFLSPVPMPALWQKARAEMRPGSLFVSNSFAVPEVEADEVCGVEDRRQTRLYCYRL
ncbi:MAG: class I SAM-dependent methyltransferase [Betaproteobacteria bacterium]|nr:class I SAM-dependent methyltransferase [Betaproteobacteria bacterium]